MADAYGWEFDRIEFQWRIDSDPYVQSSPASIDAADLVDLRSAFYIANGWADIVSAHDIDFQVQIDDTWITFTTIHNIRPGYTFGININVPQWAYVLDQPIPVSRLYRTKIDWADGTYYSNIIDFRVTSQRESKTMSMDLIAGTMTVT